MNWKKIATLALGAGALLVVDAIQASSYAYASCNPCGGGLTPDQKKSIHDEAAKLQNIGAYFAFSAGAAAFTPRIGPAVSIMFGSIAVVSTVWGNNLGAVDPIDLNYTMIAQPAVVAIPTDLGALTQLATDEVSAAALSQALYITTNRYSGAVFSGQPYWENVQQNQLIVYYNEEIAAINAVNNDINSLLSDSSASVFPTFTIDQSSTTDAQNYISQNGTPADAVQILQGLGLADSDISQASSQLSQNIPLLNAAYPGASSTDALSDILDVPEPSSIIVMGTGLLGFLFVRRGGFKV
jgi:hypothetical protein